MKVINTMICIGSLLCMSQTYTMVPRKKTLQTRASEAFDITNYSHIKDRPNVIHDLQNYTKGEQKSSYIKTFFSALVCGLGIKMFENNKIAGIAIGTLGLGGFIMYVYSCYKYRQDLHTLADNNATAEQINPIGQQAIFHCISQMQNIRKKYQGGTLYTRSILNNNKVAWDQWLKNTDNVSYTLGKNLDSRWSLDE